MVNKLRGPELQAINYEELSASIAQAKPGPKNERFQMDHIGFIDQEPDNAEVLDLIVSMIFITRARKGKIGVNSIKERFQDLPNRKITITIDNQLIRWRMEDRYFIIETLDPKKRLVTKNIYAADGYRVNEEEISY